MTHTLKRYYRKWKQVGAVAPSSRFLAQAITEHVTPSDDVLEIGAGTGVFTEVLTQKVPTQQLHVVEINPDYQEQLNDYAANVYVTDALGFLSSPPCDLSGFKAISSLPLLNFDMAFRKKLLTKLLLDARVASVRQFTYSPLRLFAPEWIAQNDLHAERIDLVFRNLPPAVVWEYTRTD